MLHLQNGFFMNWFGSQKGEGCEFHRMAIGIVIALMTAGGGTWPADQAIAGSRAD